jgi:hypothetical protein
MSFFLELMSIIHSNVQIFNLLAEIKIKTLVLFF